MLQICRVILALLTSVSFFFATMFTAAWGQVRTDQSIEETASMAIYKAAGIPYPIKYKKSGNCNFTEREIKVIRETFQILPEVYASLGNQFFFEKECVLDSKDKKSQILNLDQVHAVATSSSFFGKIILKDLVFSTIQNGELTQISESFSKKVIAHELTHQLDDKYGYSNSDNFRSINSWKRNFGFMTYDKEKAAGFQREQGMQNPSEDFATQAEGFFFEADYICKNPQAYVWFYYWIGPSKVPAVARCPDEMNTPIDPAKLKDVGYIFISSTDEYAESMFGHALVRFHMDQADPFEDFAIEAAGGISGMPSLNGYETPEELAQKQAESEKMKVSRLGFLLKGVSGQLDFKVQLLRYKLKWIETSILHGRDISERILALTQLQKRILVYMINKDIKKFNNNYNILTKNCASYIAQIINKAIGDDVAEKNAFGIHTPRNVYENFAPIVDKDLPVMEGDRARLARVLPQRENILQSLRGESLFSTVDFKALDDPMKNIELTIKSLEQIASIVKSRSTEIPTELKKNLQSLIYSYTLERSLYLQRHALKVYKKILATR